MEIAEYYKSIVGSNYAYVIQQNPVVKSL